MSASARIRRRPSIQRESGSCASTIVIVLKKKTTPIWRSFRPPWSRTNGGRRLRSE
jgi:hypothetical protein